MIGMRCAFAVAFGLLATSPALAQDRGVWFVSGMLEQDLSASAGATFALPGSTLGNGWGARPSIFTSRYMYLSGITPISGQDTGGGVVGLYQISGAWGWANFGAGLRYVDTSLSPADPGNTRQGGRLDGDFVTDGGGISGLWRTDWYMEFGPDQQNYYLRGAESYALNDSGSLRLGFEAGLQGDRNYNRSNVGALLIAGLDSRLEMRLSAGATFQSGRGDQGYVLLGFSQPF